MEPRKVKVLAFSAIFGLFAVSLWAGLVAAQDPAALQQAADTKSGSSTAILVTTIAGFASLLVTHFFQMYREARNRRWDLEDRANSRLEMRKAAEAQRVETIQTAIELARVSNINREHVLGAIRTNTELTSEAGAKADAATDAAKAAVTSFHDKLEALHAELAGLRDVLPPEAAKKDGA